MPFKGEGEGEPFLHQYVPQNPKGVGVRPVQGEGEPPFAHVCLLVHLWLVICKLMKLLAGSLVVRWKVTPLEVVHSS